MKNIDPATPLGVSAAKAGMSEKTARKYRQLQQLPSQLISPHNWRTRQDPFEQVFDQLKTFLEVDSGLEAKTLFEFLLREYPGQFQEGQLRSLQRRVGLWRATEGPGKEIFFAQEHHPGQLAESDFCHMTRLGITLCGQLFQHMLYHFVLTYSNWEFTRVCFSESFESLSEGLQAALFTLGGVPKKHRTDSLTAAVNKLDNPEEFTDRYAALARHYGLRLEHIGPQRPNENGDVEQSHNQFIRRIDQALMLRGSREFADRGEYERFLLHNIALANKAREKRFAQETALLSPLPSKPLDCRKRITVRVGPGSTVSIPHNVYSVPSRLIGHKVDAVVGSEQIDILVGGQLVATLPRLRGRGGHRIDYRHIIKWLVRKPGAFDNYVYRDALFPSSHFRIAYDAFTGAKPVEGKKDYLKLLELAADEGQSLVEMALRSLLDAHQGLDLEAVKQILQSRSVPETPAAVQIRPIDLSDYDSLLADALWLRSEVRHA